MHAAQVDVQTKHTRQHESEIRELLDFVLSCGCPDTILEIGTERGGTAYIWAQIAKRVVCVDVEFLDPIYRGTAMEKRITEITGQSEQPETVEKVKAALNGSQPSLLFIDGNHSYFGANTDYKLYTPLVAPGGWIVLHDIVNPRWDVRRFWDEIKGGRAHAEFVLQRQPAHKQSTVWGDDLQGIGILCQTPLSISKTE
jgi:cephalosporin hydroxylase